MVARVVLGVVAGFLLLVSPAVHASPTGRSAQIGRQQTGVPPMRYGLYAREAPLPGSVAPHPHGERRLGLIGRDRQLGIAIGLRLRNPSGLRALLAGIYDPHSPLYHHFLTPHQFARAFAPSIAARAAVVHWLQTNGLQVHQRYSNGLLLTTSGPASRIESVFHTAIYRYRLGRSRFFANASPVRVPASLRETIASITGLSDMARQTPAERSATLSSRAGTGPGGANSPHDLMHLYDLQPLSARGDTGSGQTIAIVAHGDYDDANIATYDHQFGLSGAVERVKVSDGVHTGADLGPSEAEIEMDIEVLQGMAPGAHILVYEGSNSAAGAIAIYHQIVSDGRAQIVTTGFGSWEGDFTPADMNPIDEALQEAAAQGETVFAASGDRGAYDENQGPQPGDPGALAVDFPASDPWVTGVGGTTLNQDAFGNYQNETA